jgi:hypothetical protein
MGLFNIDASVTANISSAVKSVQQVTDITNQLKSNVNLVGQAVAVATTSPVIKNIVKAAPMAPPVIIPVIQGSAAASGSQTAGSKMQSDYAAYMRAKNEIRTFGVSIINANPILKAGLVSLAIKGNTAAESTKGEDQQNGYAFAIGMVSRNSTESEIKAYQLKLNPSEQNGFNIGCAVMTGLHHITPTGDNLSDFGTAVAYGLNGSNSTIKDAVVMTIGSTPSVGQAIIAVAQQNQVKRSWFHRILVKLGFIKE